MPARRAGELRHSLGTRPQLYACTATLLDAVKTRGLEPGSEATLGSLEGVLPG